MQQGVRIILNRMKKFLAESSVDSQLNEYFSKQEAISQNRFWSLLRSDIMRKKPDQIAPFLQDSESKLAELGNFGRLMAAKFFSETDKTILRINHEALIYLCLEREASYRLKKIRELNPQVAGELQRKLNL